MKRPRPLELPPPTMIAVDPSLRGTGWAILNFRTGQIIAAGVIVTKAPTAREKRQMLAGEYDGRDGLQVFMGIDAVMQRWRPILSVVESPAGAQSFNGAKSIHRAQQATLDAIYRHLRALPIFISYAQVQKLATGKKSATKQEVEAAVRALWPDVDFDELLTTPPPYVEQGQKLPPPGKWENAFDACAVIHAAAKEPAVAMARQTCRR